MPSSATTQLCTLSLHDALPISGTHARSSGGDIHAGSHARHKRRLTLSRPATDEAFQLPQRHPRPARAARQRAGPCTIASGSGKGRSEEHTSELQSLRHLVCRLPPPPSSALFPYTTLFRSRGRTLGVQEETFMREAMHGTNAVSHFLGRRLTRLFSFLSATLGLLALLGSAQALARSQAVLEKVDRKSTRLNSSHLGISYAVFRHHPALHSFPTRRSSDLGDARSEFRRRHSCGKPCTAQTPSHTFSAGD